MNIMKIQSIVVILIYLFLWIFYIRGKKKSIILDIVAIIFVAVFLILLIC